MEDNNNSFGLTSGDTATTNVDSGVARAIGAPEGSQITSIATHNPTNLIVSMSEPPQVASTATTVMPNFTQRPAPQVTAIKAGLEKALSGTQSGPTPTPKLSRKNQLQLRRIYTLFQKNRVSPYTISLLKVLAPSLNGLIAQKDLDQLMPVERHRTIKVYNLNRSGQLPDIVARTVLGNDEIERTRGIQEAKKDDTPGSAALEKASTHRADYQKIKMTAAMLGAAYSDAPEPVARAKMEGEEAEGSPAPKSNPRKQWMGTSYSMAMAPHPSGTMPS